MRCFIALPLLMGCTQWAYLPVAAPPEVTVKAFGRDAAFYSIPPASPHGELRVVAYGVEKLSSDDVDVAALHVRLLATNTGSKPWTLDTREQQVELPQGTEAAAFVASDRAGDGSSPPVLDLTFGATRIADLFFPLPEGMTADTLPAFRLHTLVHTDEGDVSETTAFTRESVSIYYGMEDAQMDDDTYLYWDSPVWFNEGYVGAFGVRVQPGWRSARFYAHPTVWARSGTSTGGGSRGGSRRGTWHGGGHVGGHVGGGHGGGGHR